MDEIATKSPRLVFSIFFDFFDFFLFFIPSNHTWTSISERTVRSILLISYQAPQKIM